MNGEGRERLGEQEILWGGRLPFSSLTSSPPPSPLFSAKVPPVVSASFPPEAPTALPPSPSQNARRNKGGGRGSAADKSRQIAFATFLSYFEGVAWLVGWGKFSPIHHGRI